MTFWESVSDLRRLEFVTLLVTMIVPVISGTVLFTIRHRIKMIQTVSSQNRGLTYQENVQVLEEERDRLTQELIVARKELTMLRHISAPRQITEPQAHLIVEQLRGFKASPVIVSAYAFEEESAAYAAEIVLALRKAGWEATLNKASMNDFKGVALGMLNATHQPLSGLHELSQAFTAAQLDLRQRAIAPDSIAGPLQDGCLLVVVGRK